MTTPRKSEIIEKALELWHKEQWKNGTHFTVNPTVEELKESGYYQTAQQILMCSNPYKIVIEQRKKSEIEECEDLDPYPIDMIMKEGCVVNGSRGCGKTNLLKLLVSKALEQKIEVKLFDPSLAWKNFPLPILKVKHGDLNVESRFNVIYDVSRLSVLETRKFVSNMISRDLQEAIALADLGKKPTCLIIFEEVQNIMPSNTLRLLKFQDVSRFVSQGRNFGLSFLCSTQRLARVDIDLVEISGVKYWFKLEGHRNLTKARYWLDKYHVWNLRNLEVGQCYLQVGGKIKMLRLPIFQCKKEEVIAQ